MSYEDGQQLAKHMKACFVELSAKQSAQVNHLFETLVTSIEEARGTDSVSLKKTPLCTVS